LVAAISRFERMNRLNAELRVAPDTPAPDGPGPAAATSRDGRVIRIVREVSLALAIYGMAGWIYVGICALVAPQTLALPLTHLLPSLREDTSGVLSFIVSFLGFISYRLTRRGR
jgi:hypothetical protein